MAKHAANKAAREDAGVMKEVSKLEKEDARFEAGADAKLEKIHKADRMGEREAEAEAVQKKKH